MSTDRDVTSIVRSWLDEGVTALPDRVLDAVLDQVPATPQRRAWWPVRRLPEVSTNAKLALAAAAVLAVAFLGLRFMLPNVGAPTETPEPTPIPSPVALPVQGPLEPGTYLVEDPDITPRSFTIKVPAGWTTEEGFISKGDAEGVTTRDVFITSWIVTHVFEDACLRPGLDADSLVEARSPDELVNALATQGGHETSGPTPVTVGGFPARRFEVTFPDDYDLAACDDRALRLWPGAEADVSSGQPANVGQRFLIYVVDVDGDAVVMVAASRSDASPSDITEMEAALASIQFTGSDAP